MNDPQESTKASEAGQRSPSTLPGAGEVGLTLSYDGSMSPVASTDPLPETIGRHRILKRLGKGGMGIVYLAEDTQLRRTIVRMRPCVSRRAT